MRSNHNRHRYFDIIQSFLENSSNINERLIESWNLVGKLQFQVKVQLITLSWWFQTASVLEEATKLRDENLLIVHGTADGGFLFDFTPITSSGGFSSSLRFDILCVFKSKGPLPAQRGATEPTGEGGGQLLPPAVPRWGPHSEGPTQRPALPADCGQLPPKLPEAQRLPGTRGGWRGGGRVSPEPLAFFLKASPWTFHHLLHFLGSGCQAHGPNSGEQADPNTTWKFWSNRLLFLVAHINFNRLYVWDSLFTTFSSDDVRCQKSAQGLRRFLKPAAWYIDRVALPRSWVQKYTYRFYNCITKCVLERNDARRETFLKRYITWRCNKITRGEKDCFNPTMACRSSMCSLILSV